MFGVSCMIFFFFQAEDGIRDDLVTGVQTCALPILQAYNTRLVKKEDLPKTFQDLLDPKWKGKLGIEANVPEWYSTVVLNMGEDKGIKFFRDLVGRNGISVRTGHSLLNNMVVAGEVPLALTVYNFMAEAARR